MRKVIFLAVALMVSGSIFAQRGKEGFKPNEYGPTVGLTTNSQMVVTNVTELQDLFNGFHPGIQLGGFGRTNIKMRHCSAYFQLDAQFAWDIYRANGSKASVASLNFPFRFGLGYNFSKNVRLRTNIGVVFSGNLSTNVDTKFDGYETELEDAIRREVLGWIGGVGVDIKNKYSVDLNCNWQKRSKSIVNVAEKMSYVNYSLSVSRLF